MAKNTAKVQSVEDIVKVYERLNQVMSNTVDLSAKHAANLRAASASNAGEQIAGGAPQSLVPTPTFTGMSSGQVLAAGASSVYNLAKGLGAAMATAIPSVNNALDLQLTAARANMSGYQGDPNQLLGQIMSTGTSTGQMDAVRAMAYGQSAGIVPGLASYGDVMSGVAGMSNMVPGMGLEGGMRAAAGLNQGRSVNALRMMGVNVRDAQGNMRDPQAIFKEFYNQIVKTSGRDHPPTPEELSKSLQPGNGLSNLLDQFFGANTELRQSMQGAAYQFAQGGDMSRASAVSTGAGTEALASQSAKYGSEYNALSAATPSLTKGFTEANEILTKLNEKLANLYENSNEAQWALKQLAKADTLASDKVGGAALTAAGALVTAALEVASIAAAARIGSAAGGGGSGGITALAKGAKYLGVAGLGAAEGYFGEKLASAAGEHLGWPGTTTKTVSVLGSAAAGAATGAMIMGVPGAIVGGGVAALTAYLSGRTSHTDPGQSGNGKGAAPTGVPVRGGAASAAGAIASSQIGVPYSWGGGGMTGPSGGYGRGAGVKGFDCSSLMVFVFGRLGISLPRTAHEQQKVGTRIDPKDAQPGDLLFWGEPAHHVALYVGNGMMIQSPHTGGHVEQVSVNLNGVTTASRVLNQNGVNPPSDIIDKRSNNTGVDVTSGLFDQFPVLNSFSGYAGSTPTLSAAVYDPNAAMSGITTGQSGLGLGNSSGAGASPTREALRAAASRGYQASHAMGSENALGAPQINYGGVALYFTLPKSAALSEKILVREIKDQLKDLETTVRVATT